MVLSEIAFKYKTDKCPQIKHHFTKFYTELLQDRREEIKKVVEIGIGFESPYYVKGASLYMWREYLPNAHIYGADILINRLFTDDRISTYLCDQSSEKDLHKLIKNTGTDIDLFIDDGSHLREHQIFTCLTVMPLLDRGVTYIIEDIYFKEIPEELKIYECEIWQPRYRYSIDDRLLVIRHGKD